MRVAYADPPYPGLSKRYYGDQSTYEGEVNHRALIASLRARVEAGQLDAWALSTSAEALRDLLPLCPPHVKIRPWLKDLEVPPSTFGPHVRWEVLLVVGGRQLRPGVRDWFDGRPARLGGSNLMGRKPIAFWAWLFDMLGMVPGDDFEDMFPGTGTGARAWAHLSSVARETADASPPAAQTRVALTRLDTSLLQDASRVDGRRASRHGIARRVAHDVAETEAA